MGGPERQPLYTLGRPVRAYPVTRDSPDLLCIGLEESLIESASKAIRDPLFQRILIWMRPNSRLEVTEHCPSTFPDSEIGQGVEGFEGVLVEASLVIDARLPGDGMEVFTQHRFPQLTDFPDLGVEAVPSYVEAIAAVGFGSGQPARFVERLDDERALVLLHRTESSGQTRGSSSYDYDSVRSSCLHLSLPCGKTPWERPPPAPSVVA